MSDSTITTNFDDETTFQTFTTAQDSVTDQIPTRNDSLELRFNSFIPSQYNEMDQDSVTEEFSTMKSLTTLNLESLNPFQDNDVYIDPITNEFLRGLETTVAVVLLIYLILGLSGNLLTIVALLKCPKIRNVTAAFIISLCVADCIFCILVLPWEVMRFFVGKWMWGHGPICTVVPLIRYWTVGVSLMSIAMIAINRYIMIAHNSIYKTIYKTGWIALMIAFCWLFPFCILIPTLLGKWGRFGFTPELDTCSIVDVNGRSPKKFLFGLGFCIPALVIIICYSLIFYEVRKSDSRLRKHNIAASAGSNRNSAISLQSKLPGKVDKDVNRKKNEWRVTKMVLIIFLAFLSTNLPITLVKSFDPTADIKALHLLGYVMVYLSCCINPVIYVIMSRQYRKAYRSVLLCTKPVLHTFTSNGAKTPARDRCPKRRTSRLHSEDRTIMSQISESDLAPETTTPEYAVELTRKTPTIVIS